METHQPNSDYRRLTRDEAYEIRQPTSEDAQLPESSLLREPLAEAAEKIRAEAISLIQSGIDAGILPENLRERLPFLSQIDFSLNDQQGEAGYNINQMAASADSNIYGLPLGWAEIDSVWHAKIDYPESTYKNLVHVTMHEFIHALSGVSYYTKTDKLSFHRHGLDATTEQQPHDFRWLSEAMTERLTLKILALNDIQSTRRAYGDEQKLLDLIIAKSKVPIENALIEAYFEDRDPVANFPSSEEYTNNPEQPARQRLGRAVAEGFNRGFLNRLNRLVIRKNTNTADKALEADDFSPEKIELLP